MPSVKDIVASYPALNEFGLLARAILPVMTDANISRDKKRKTLAGLVDNLSEKAFKNKIVIAKVMTIINMKEKVCREYPDSEAQTEGILEWLPRMKEHRKVLLEEVKKHRKQYGLKV